MDLLTLDVATVTTVHRLEAFHPGLQSKRGPHVLSARVTTSSQAPSLERWGIFQISYFIWSFFLGGRSSNVDIFMGWFSCLLFFMCLESQDVICTLSMAGTINRFISLQGTFFEISWALLALLPSSQLSFRIHGSNATNYVTMSCMFLAMSSFLLSPYLPGQPSQTLSSPMHFSNSNALTRSCTRHFLFNSNLSFLSPHH